MKTSDFDYQLPLERIAQEPIEPRDSSRLLVLHRKSGHIEHTWFREIGRFLKKGDLLVLNRSRVVPGRLFARKFPSRGKAEILLLERVDSRHWKALVGGRGLKVGRKLELPSGNRAEIAENLGGAQRLLAFEQSADEDIRSSGIMPLPPYIHAPLKDPERYQTVYSREMGSAASPTAGLHFTQQLIERIKNEGISFAEVVLHIGLDTFAPVNEADPGQHQIHSEWCRLSTPAAARINKTHSEGGRVIAVGTTCVRTLETAAQLAGTGERVAPFEGRTNLFILPGFQFRVVDALLTNFHLPRSTLLMLVSAFAERELILHTYRLAIAKGYRFYSFGDAMLIL